MSTPTVTEHDFPAVYQGYNETSAKAQQGYLRSQKWLLWLLAAAAATAALPPVAAMFLMAEHVKRIESGAALVAAALFAVSVVLSSRQQQNARPEVWYNARALAESVKSIAWKFMMRAEPYARDDADSLFTRDVRALMKDVQEKAIPAASDGEQITSVMRHVRSLPVAERTALYRANRIEDQRAWYTRRSKEHDALNSKWQRVVTWTLVIAAVLNGVSVLATPLPALAGVATAIVPCAIAWNQTRRHRELAHSYGFTSHEIGLIAAGADPTKEEDIARFVADCEAAFSREHTMWRARRENPET